MKKKFIIITILLALLGFAAYEAYNIFLKPDNFRRQIYLIPSDAMFIVETDDPVNNWQKFSNSPAWQYLRGQERMAEISKNATTLDSILHENNTLLNLLGKRNLMISAHKTRTSDYDFLFVADLQKASKAETLKSQLENLFESMDYQVTTRRFEDCNIVELFDPEEHSTLYLSFIDNHLVCSYTVQLLEKSIKEKNNPEIGRNLYFQDVEQKLRGSSLCRIYINYEYFNDYVTIMSGVNDSDLNAIFASMHFSGLQMDMSDDQLSFKGYTNLQEASDSYLAALLQSGQSEITVQRVLSNRTAFFMAMGFDDALKFIDNVERVLQNNQVSYQSYKKNWQTIEKFLDIDIRDHFLSWMEGEVVFAQNTQGTLGRQNEFVAVIKVKDKDDAIKNLNIIEEHIRKKTPIKFKTIEYEGYTIHYLEIKGFFRLLFGKMFDKLNKPYYTIIDDYVVFSNSTATLLSMIEDYRLGQTLDKDEDFNHFMDEFNNEASIFAYTNAPKFFPLWKDLVASSTWQSMQANRNFITCFPQMAFQLTADNNVFDTRLVAEFQKPEDTEELPITMEEDFMLSEDTLSSLESFYVEKMTGNVYTEFYESGTVKSQTEMKNGIRNGKHKSFFEDEKLKMYGKFRNNKKTGTWHIYGEDGLLVAKERWKDGVKLK